MNHRIYNKYKNKKLFNKLKKFYQKLKILKNKKYKNIKQMKILIQDHGKIIKR